MKRMKKNMETVHIHGLVFSGRFTIRGGRARQTLDKDLPAGCIPSPKFSAFVSWINPFEPFGRKRTTVCLCCVIT